jgi:ABC-type transporter Mla subunit MlaD
MFIGYLVIVGTRSLVMWVEFWLMPLITGKIVNKNVVRKSEFDEVVKEREEYFDQYEEQRKNVRYFSKTIDDQTEQIKQKDINFLEQTNTINKNQKDLEFLNRQLDNLKTENKTNIQKISEINTALKTLENDNATKIEQIRKYRNLFSSSENEPFYSSFDKFPPEVLNKVKELKDKNKWETFKYVGNFFTKGGSMGGETLTEMIELGISFDRDTREDFTPLGEIIWKYRNLFEKENYEVY